MSYSTSSRLLELVGKYNELTCKSNSNCIRIPTYLDVYAVFIKLQ